MRNKLKSLRSREAVNHASSNLCLIPKKKPTHRCPILQQHCIPFESCGWLRALASEFTQCAQRVVAKKIPSNTDRYCSYIHISRTCATAKFVRRVRNRLNASRRQVLNEHFFQIARCHESFAVLRNLEIKNVN